jgi:peptidoglycan/LPS O-acetylase OafA/YrhL
MFGNAGVASYQSRLVSLEVGRFIAALMVAMFHFEGFCQKYFSELGFDNYLRGGHSGVEYFFVLSGFIIYHIHRKDIGHPGRITDFFKKRAIRILPMYWLILLPIGLVFALLPHWGAEKELTVWKFLLDAFLIPRPGDMTLPPAWTLEREMIFYAVFGVLIISRQWGWRLLMVWQVGIVVGAALSLFPEGGLGDIFFGIYNIGFACGMLAAWTCERAAGFGKGAEAITGLGLVIYLGLLIREWQIGHDIPSDLNPFGQNLGPILYYLGATLLVFGLVSLERKYTFKDWRAAEIAGGASYMLYLIHEPFSSVVMKILSSGSIRPYMTASGAYFILVIGSIAAAVALHLAIEKPLLRQLRNWLLPTKPASELTRGEIRLSVR